MSTLQQMLVVGIGDKFDETKLKAYPAGSFIVIPADV
jgi:hypothetical protein